MSKIGIDISQYQTNVDYNEVAKNTSFAILRIGYGVQYIPEKQRDKQFDNHYAGLYGKIPLGGYYYSYAKKIGDGRKEAENCLRYLQNRYLDMPIFYDLEDKTSQGLSTEDLTNIALEFVEEIKKAGYDAGIYCSKYWAEHELDMSKFDKEDIWVASYGTNNGEIQERYKYNGRQNIWQYTSRGYLSGINGYVDMNILYDLLNEEIKDPVQVEQPKVVYSGDNTIKGIQQWLNDNYNTGIAVDGYYGSQTKKALVKALQTEFNRQFGTRLAVDGIFGEQSKNACRNIKQGAKGNITRIIQSMLYCKGYNTNGIEGIFGQATDGAVRRFQANSGLNADGVVGKLTFAKLFE